MVSSDMFKFLTPNPLQAAAEQKDRSARVGAGISALGYSRVKLTHPDGSCSIERIYLGTCWQYQQSSRAWVLYKLLYLLLLAGGVALSVLSMRLPSALNSTDLAGILEIIPFIPLMYFIYTMFYQISAPRHMETHQHTLASKHMRIGALIYGLCLTASAIGMLIYATVNQFVFDSATIFCVAGPLLNAVFIFLIFALETRRRCAFAQSGLPDNAELLD